MTDTSKISILVPMFNSERTIERTINSIIQQTYKNWECIVVDDGSTDQSLATVEKLMQDSKHIKLLTRNRLPKGAPTCRNIGLYHATGDYVIFLDSDDYLLPFCLEQRLKTFQKNANCNFLIFPSGQLINNIESKVDLPISNDYLKNFLSALLPWNVMSPIWKKSTLLKLQGFTEGYPRFNDPDLMIRALLIEDIKFKVFNNKSHDCVYVHYDKEQNNFNDKVYKSIKLFIPDTCKTLANVNKNSHKTYLILYLHLWFKYFYKVYPKGYFFKSMRLINLFRACDIISVKHAVKIFTLLVLQRINVIFGKSNFNRLTPKSLYIKN